jgi:hypothetical protein
MSSQAQTGGSDGLEPNARDAEPEDVAA